MEQLYVQQLLTTSSAFALLVLACTSLSQLLILMINRRRKSVVAAHHHHADDAQTFPPVPPGSWPILGHLPFLSTGCPHHVLAQLARAPPPTGLGPIIGLRLGSKRAVVVCNAHLAKEVLFTHDKIMAHRPHFVLSDHIYYGYDTSISFSSLNPRWALLRKLCTLELFTPKRLQALQYVRYEEVHCLLRSLREASHADTQHPVDLGELLSLMLCNSMGRILHSNTLDEVGGHDYPSLLKDHEHAVAPTIGDFLPWLKFLDLLPKRAMKHIHDQMDKILETMITQRRLLLKSRKADEPLPQDLLQVLLSREAKNQHTSIEQDELLNMNEIKGTLMDVLSAGTHTTALTLEWAMVELLKNPHCMQKLRAEIDAVMGTGPDHFVSDEDIPELPYLMKVVKEVFRLHPVGPLLIPRVASEAVKMDKYTLPAKTLVFVNVWAIGRDPDVWHNPEEFRPERFDAGHRDQIDVKGQHYDLLPFGSGRRICPGLRLALSVVHVTLANLVRTFDWELPNGQKPEDLDMSEKRGITIMRSTPLLAIPKTRNLAA